MRHDFCDGVSIADLTTSATARRRGEAEIEFYALLRSEPGIDKRATLLFQIIDGQKELASRRRPT